MKKLLSLTLALMILLSAVTAWSVSTAAAAVFKAGDVLYFKVEKPAAWAQDCTLYANFTAFSRADNNDKSIVIADADPAQVHPVTGIVYDSARGLYSYTVTEADAGAAVMRFWRGDHEKLWNCSVAVSADDYAQGKNTAVITDWTDSGSLSSTYAYDLKARLSLSAAQGEVGDSFEIRAVYDVPDILTVRTQIYIDDEKVSDEEVYTFRPAASGVYSVRADLVAARFDDAGAVLAKESVSGSISVGTTPVANLTGSALYAHASRGSKEREAWIKWRTSGDDYYLFLPSSIKEGEPVELYNAYSTEVTLDSETIPANSIADFTPQAGQGYLFRQGRTTRTVKFMYSTAEAALFVNNAEDFNGVDFLTYLQTNKENSVSAAGALARTDGTVSDCEVKKMKGRGNTSWDADKKGFNITFKEAVSVAGMEMCKKYSLLSNFQDAAMARNRILYDMSDAVGVPYASDSRFVDLYTNGVYQGTYQMCQKVDVGKDSLMPDIDEKDYLDAVAGGVKEDFSFVTEIDSSPAHDDFHFTVMNGNNLTMKSPELKEDDPNINAVRTYVESKFNAMFNKLSANAEDTDDYIDLDSLAKVYLINELGKNWDSGASSFYLTYRPDKNGKYKFFASPVWDYDNTLGNARGVEGDLRRMGVSDYELPSGWFSTVKGGYRGPNFLATAAKNAAVMKRVYTVWFEDFLPAIDTLTSTGVSEGELYSGDVYAGILRGTAAMNYKVWALETDGEWVCDHSSITQYHAAYTRSANGQVTAVELTRDSQPTAYDQYTFDGQFDYMMDWMTSRAAWISAQYIAKYEPTDPGTQPSEPSEDPGEEPGIVPYPAPPFDRSHLLAAWVFDDRAKTEGEKLSEYGSADGYRATEGEGTLTMSVDGSNARALEWSAPEYGPSGKSMTPIMAAGKNNLWGSPYIDLTLPTKGYEDIRLTMYLAGSNKAPANWKLLYGIDGETFTEVDGTAFSITADQRKELTAYLRASLLPDDASDRDSLTLRLVPVDMTTVSGGNTADKPSGGEIALNYIVVQGVTADRSNDLLGDVNFSGAVDITDATLIQRSLAGLITLSERQKMLADTDRSGKMEIVDATFIQRYLAGIIREF